MDFPLTKFLNASGSFIKRVTLMGIMLYIRDSIGSSYYARNKTNSFALFDNNDMNLCETGDPQH